MENTMVNGHITWEWWYKSMEYHAKNYIPWWETMMEEIHSGTYCNHIWMIGPSGYFGRIGDVKFAVDTAWWIPGTFEEVAPKLEKDMGSLDFVMFTHDHGDHFMVEQIATAKNSDTKWIIPKCMERAFLRTGVPKENCIFLEAGDEVMVKDARIEAFLGHHHYLDGTKGPESLMYTIKTAEKNVFITSDVRDYNPEYIPKGSHFDSVIFNIYISKESGYAYPFSDYYPLAVEFAAAMDTQNLLVGHLYGFGCPGPDEIWNFMHVGMLEDGLYCLRPDMEVHALKTGKRYAL